MDIYLERIKPLIDSYPMDDNKIEEALGLPKGVIYKWGKNENKSYKKYIEPLADFLKVSPVYLLGLTDDPTPKKNPAPTDGDGLKILTKDNIGDLLDEMSTDELISLAADIMAKAKERNGR